MKYQININQFRISDKLYFMFHDQISHDTKSELLKVITSEIACWIIAENYESLSDYEC